MTQVRSVQLGGIDLHGERVFTTVKGKRHDLIYDLNCWLFDYFWSNKKPVVQLPPLDDWKHSLEDDSFWYFELPDISGYIWIKSEPVEF